MDCSSKELKAYRDLLLEKGIAVSLGESKIAAEICRWALPEFDEETANLFVAGRFSSGAEELLILPPDQDVLRAVKRGLHKAFPVHGEDSRAKDFGRGAGFAIERALKRMRKKAIAKDPESGKPKAGDPKVGDVLTIISRHKLVYKVASVKRIADAFNRLEIQFDVGSTHPDYPSGARVFMDGREAERFIAYFRERGYVPGSNCTIDSFKEEEILSKAPREQPKDPGLAQKVYNDVKKILRSIDGADARWDRARKRGLTDDELEAFLDAQIGQQIGLPEGVTMRSTGEIEREGKGGYEVSGKKFFQAVRWAMKVPRIAAKLGIGTGVTV